MTAVLRVDERVKPLELFFDLVFVLALTQCTTLIVSTPTWEGMLKGLLVLGAGENTIRLSPPLLIDQEQADFAVRTLEDCFREAGEKI